MLQNNYWRSHGFGFDTVVEKINITLLPCRERESKTKLMDMKKI